MKTFIKFIFVVAVAVLFSGYGSGEPADDSQELIKIIKGTLVDSPVEGVKYFCGDVEGFTNESGVFRCEELPVEFMVGNILLGKVKTLPEDKIITPQDLAGVDRKDINNSKVANIAVILQSLDDDGIIEDLITIDDEITSNLEKRLDVRKMKENELKDLLEDAGVRFVIPRSMALKNLKRSMLKIIGGEDFTKYKNGISIDKDGKLIVDSKKGIVINRDTKLIWQNSKIGYGVREEAIKFCKSLSLNGLEWRLPTSKESKRFHRQMNEQGIVPEQSSPESEVEVVKDGYVLTLEGSQSYEREPGDIMEEFQDKADVRCVSGQIENLILNIDKSSDHKNPNGTNNIKTNSDNGLHGIKLNGNRPNIAKPSGSGHKLRATKPDNSRFGDIGSDSNRLNGINDFENNARSKSVGSSGKFFTLYPRRGIAIDNKTKKIWQNARIGHGNRKLAIKFCKYLSLDGRKWRLPTSDESKRFHRYMNAQGDVPRQAFSKCAFEVTKDGHVRTLKGALHGKRPGDRIYLGSEVAGNIRCVSDSKNANINSSNTNNSKNNKNNNTKVSVKNKKFSVYPRKGIAVDKDTKLTWQNVRIRRSTTRARAIKICKNLSLGGFEWRLPTSSESRRFHKYMTQQGNTPKQASSNSIVEITKNGYVVTSKGASRYKRKAGDSVRFRGRADVRCVTDGTKKSTTKNTNTNGSNTNNSKNNKNNNTKVSAKNKKFSVYPRKGIAVDKDTKLTWQNVRIRRSTTRARAIKICKNLSLGGFEWRLPTSSESRRFHKYMTQQGNTPKQASSNSIVEITKNGYVVTSKGASRYKRKAGDSVRFRGRADVRCVTDGTKKSTTKNTNTNGSNTNNSKNNKNNNTKVSAKNKKFSVYPRKGIAVDKDTKLTWQNVRIRRSTTRARAIKICKNLSLGGFEWRLPTSSESRRFHKYMTQQGNTPKQASSNSIVEITKNGYVVTSKGASRYKRKAGDSVRFKGRADVRCVTDGTKKSKTNGKATGSGNTANGSKNSNSSNNNTKKISDKDKKIVPFPQKGIAIDKDTKLIWQNTKIGRGTRMEAIKFCKHLSLNRIQWRLPTSSESKRFHKYMNEQGDTPKQASSSSTVEVTKNGYIVTSKGASRYKKRAGDSVRFRGRADVRCVAGGIKKSNNNKTKGNKTNTNNNSNNKNNNGGKTSSGEKKFTVDSGKGIAIDKETKMVWQNSRIGHGTRDKAIEFCKYLSLDGRKWRLPTSSESRRFHRYMNEQGDVPKQAFSRCLAEVTKDGYVRTLRGARYRGKPGDNINFRGPANIRCVSDGTGSKTTDSTDNSDNNKDGSKKSYSKNVKPLSDNLKNQFLKAINDARAKGRRCGKYGYFKAVPPLKWNDTLYIASYRHSFDMSEINYFSHTGSGKESDLAAQAYHPGKGSSMTERIYYAGYKRWRRLGENIAAGTNMNTAKKAVDAWIKSPGHCRNLMSPNFTEVSLAVVSDQDSHYRNYWTQNFGLR